MAGKSVRVKPVAGPLERSAQRVAAWDKLAGGVARYRYPILVAVAVAVVAAGQLIEDAADGGIQMLSPSQSIRRWTMVALVLYELVMAAAVYRTVRRSVDALRRVVKPDAPTFGAYERAMAHRDWRTDVVLAAVSVAIVFALFLVLGLDLLDDDPSRDQPVTLPTAPLAAGVVLAGYTVLGWAGLKLLYVAARFGRLLGRLSREPLEINVFDTTPLLPFGNIALAVALAPAGIIAILLLGLGPPTGLIGWIILVVASMASLLALLLPLRGIHRQMSEAKDAAMATLNVRINRLFEDVAATPATTPTALARFSDSTAALIPLRKTVSEMTTWPFRDTLAFGRAVLIAMAPLIYTTLSELIRVFFIAPLGR